MAIQFACAQCGKTLSVKDELAGKRVKCSCGAIVVAQAGLAAAERPSGPRPAAERPGTPAPSGPRSTAPRSTQHPGGDVGGPLGAGDSDLSALFDELTESDLKPQSAVDAEVAAAHATKKDPLAAYTSTAPGAGAAGAKPTGLIKFVKNKPVVAGLVAVVLVGAIAVAGYLVLQLLTGE